MKKSKALANLNSSKLEGYSVQVKALCKAIKWIPGLSQYVKYVQAAFKALQLLGYIKEALSDGDGLTNQEAQKILKKAGPILRKVAK